VTFNSYAIQAQIIDIRVDTPKAEDAFFVDTNVWYWMTYTRASQITWRRVAERYQLEHYPTYTTNALQAKAKIFKSGLTLAELTHLIEKTEFEIYVGKSKAKMKIKEFRHFSAQRQQVTAEIEAAWMQVTSMADPLTLTIDTSTVNAALCSLQRDEVDGYDLFYLESMKKHGVVQIITDDSDFATVSGIQVFTANENLIKEARVQGKLLTR